MNKESQIAPNDTRFKKGHSGNAKGRPRKPVRPLSTGSQFRKVAKDQITIEIAGSLYKTSRWNAYVRQIYNMALNKNSSAARLLEQLRRWFPGDLLPGDPTIYLITEADAKL
jgi:hypothetical protein